MLGQPPRFYSIANFSQIAQTSSNTNNSNSVNNSSLRSLSRLADEALQFDLNRNSLAGGEHPFYPNPLGIYNERKFMDLNKANHIHRGGFPRRMSYSPYPPVSPISPFRTGLSLPDRIDYGNAQDPNHLSNKATMPMESLGEYCAEILNRDKHYWTDDETSLMLELYEENKDHFNDSKTKKTKIWNVIAGIVNKKLNTSVNAEQCSQKYRNLKAEFFKVSENAEDGGAKKFGVHFEQMKRLLDAEEKPSSRSSQVNKQSSNEWFREEVLDSNDKSLLTKTQEVNGKVITNTDNTLASFSSAETSNTSPSNSFATTSSTNFPIVTTPLELFTANNIEYLKIPYNTKKDTSPINNGVSKNNEKCEAEEPEKMSTVIENENTQTAHNTIIEPANESRHSPLKEHACQKYGKNCHVTYGKELHDMFHEYFVSRDKELEKYIMKQKENIECMNKCIAVFQQALKNKMAT